MPLTRCLRSVRPLTYGSIVRPLLFALPAETSHSLAKIALGSKLLRPLFTAGAGAKTEARLKCSFAGVELTNPIGLAAGFDKDCDLLEGLSCLGFGFVTVGTIMPNVRPGNRRPRLVRYPEAESIADSMGLPSKGREHSIARLRAFRRRGVPIFANVGGFRADDIAETCEGLSRYVAGIEISLLCPNVHKAAEFDEVRLLSDVLDRFPGRDALTVRIPNDTTADAGRLKTLVEFCIERGVKGVKVGGGRRIAEPRLGTGAGTLHGRAIFARALQNVGAVAEISGGRIPIKGNGGIASGEDVLAMRKAGASCVDIYSAFIYRGWNVARQMNRELLRLSPRGELERLEGAVVV
jgi:dihydroorotate dehydrogenase